MRIGLFAVGRLKAGPEKELASRYLDRFAKAGPAVSLELSRVTEVNESRASAAETRKREEAALLEKSLADGTVLVRDESGAEFRCEEDDARLSDDFKAFIRTISEDCGYLIP